MDIRKLQRVIVDGLEDVKAQHIVVFNTEHLSALFERVIIASGTSNRQTKSLASSVRESVKDAGYPIPRLEGEGNGEWIIVDCGAAVVHVMQPTIREYYHLEEIWGDKPVNMKLGSNKSGLVKASEDESDGEVSKGASSTKTTRVRAAPPVAAKKSPARKVSSVRGAARQPVGAAGSARVPVARQPSTAAGKAAVRGPVTGKTASRETAAGKTALRKTATTKIAAAKTAASKPITPRTMAAKTAAPKPTLSKTAASKTVASKTIASKSVTSKTAASKTAASNTAARKTPAFTGPVVTRVVGVKRATAASEKVVTSTRPPARKVASKSAAAKRPAARKTPARS